MHSGGQCDAKRCWQLAIRAQLAEWGFTPRRGPCDVSDPWFRMDVYSPGECRSSKPFKKFIFFFFRDSRVRSGNAILLCVPWDLVFASLFEIRQLCALVPPWSFCRFYFVSFCSHVFHHWECYSPCFYTFEVCAFGVCAFEVCAQGFTPARMRL